MPESDPPDPIAIIGGGYAGLHAAAALRRAGVRSLVIDPGPRHDFVTRLAAVAGGTAAPADAGAPLTRFHPDVVPVGAARVDDGRVTLDDGSTIDASAVIVATGSVPASPPIDGLDHAYGLRTSGDALRLREALTGATEVIVAGGGPTGVQLAGAISSRRGAPPVTIVERDERLLAGMSPRLGRHAAAVLQGRGVEVRLGTEIERFEPHAVVLASGHRLAGVPVWAGGFEAAGSALGAHLPLDDGRIAVDDTLRIRGWERTFAVGDVAAHRDRAGEPLAMTAQIAVQAGTAAGRNAARLVRGRSPVPVRLQHRGWVLDLGGGRGVGEVGPLELAAPVVDRLAPLLHAGIDVKNLVEIGGLSALRHAPGLGGWCGLGQPDGAERKVLAAG